ncbi:cyclic pyranopterin phosphate synthase [Chelonobacter oris]|uniref:GTP 3',8-cyclase n=1 Tax=Chelonobacter oris TaxID=505317 RepID=A0A0A3AND3_9PAST|nr:GTP 3',8-cyclase MoaA [Chelonobacter oris]KGQ70851.1 molybdenum cofactor biosynthesis protein A [Chelonobacter oris]MDH2999337.1 cyclic pyranopterin phosphate synthase [Chelonobacter oris]
MQQTIPIHLIDEPQVLIDRFRRKYHYLRLSVTDVCNFKCNYCLPDGYRPEADKPSFLTLSEIRRLINAFAAMGTQKVRLTGGEPTLRKDFTRIIETVRANDKIQQIALTTNGYRMAKSVADWQAAGLDAINVSVDSLDPKMFRQITGENLFHQVMAGIDKAFEIGYQRIKVNSVLMKGLNDQDFTAFLTWIKDRPIEMRFIELMQTGEMDHFFRRHHLPGSVLMEKLLQNGWRLQARAKTDGPANVFKHPDYQGAIGLIMPYSKDFCADCNRLRVSAKGQLHLCLFGEEGTDIRDLLQHDWQQAPLQTRLFSALQQKREHHYLHQGDSGVRPHLASIGG